ncbi:armadillo-type protein [Tricharina praecox]|uniref:armadillo-type protein n=1 Tax=Tricharina praecox TaxID=43433 RepID=UPI00221F628E|nr:armadillo-type protein [Tricharina praecox]KAI5852319.1 armadillo-type protein [Tricharina praecox]
MAFSASVHDRHLDEMRFRSIEGQQFPSSSTSYAPLRNGSELGNHNQPPSSATADVRAGLTRRFTADAMITPPIGSVWDQSRLPRIPVSESMDDSLGEDERKRVQMLIQQKQMAYESRRQEQKKYEARMKLMELQNRKDEEEILRMAQNLDRMAMTNNPRDRVSLSAGHSEPTTPPEFRDGPYGRSKAAMAPASLLATPPTVSNRLDQQQLITPPSEDVLSLLSQSNSRSVPGSRRNSDENQARGTPTQAPIGQRSMIRNSLPNNSLDNQNSMQSGTSRFGLGSINTADFLFDDDHTDKSNAEKKTATTSPDVKSYLQMMSTDNKFPILTQSHPGKLSASSAALDLAYPENAGGQMEQQQLWGHTTFTRSHRPAQHSLPVNNFPYTPTSNSSPKVVPQTDSPGIRRFERSSTDFPFSTFSENLSAKITQTESGQSRQGTMPKLQPSFSTSDIPTMRAASSSSNNMQNNTFGRGPIDRQRHSRELSVTAANNSATMFGPPLSAGMVHMPVIPNTGMAPLPSPGLYGAYGHINLQSISAAPVFHTTPYGPPYPLYKQAGAVPDSPHQMQGRNMQKRGSEGEVNRFANVKLETLVNEIYTLCKDQHGCRYLQKKLEEGNPQYVEMIFKETHSHVIELMTDPFGNYLCQKLLEFTNDKQRTVLVNTAAPRLVDIALNQHGTRALQKMIEFLSTREQIDTIVHALESKVVELIQDLNGNHVIQKCLNRLKPEDAQFIFDAVGENCIPVGTHRHGCCVLQRCIDHASGLQKVQLIQRITAHSLELVQDAFGNYVVQYILDLGEPTLSEPVILKFCGMICELAKQKFSSNVIEKCIRVAETPTKKILIEEIVASGRMDDMLRDCYANYVIQTSIDYADPVTRQKLAEVIMPLLPSIRNFPYGRRIQSKLGTMNENKMNMPFQNGGSPSGHSRSSSYNPPPQMRPNVHNQGPMRPTPVQQHSYPPPFHPEMGTQFLV